MRLLLLLGLLSMSACAAHAPRVPGPLRPLGRDGGALAHPVLVDPGDQPSDDLWDPDAPPPAATLQVTGRTDPFGEAMASAAEHYLKARPRGFRDDCSGFVMACLDRAGAPMAGNTASFWEAAQELGATHKRKRPRVGDLVFFDNTYDRNRNGRWDDDLSHIAVVTAVEPDGTVHMAHGGTSRGRTTLTMNLLRPGDRTDEDGKVLNDYLRVRRSSDPKHFRYLAGELWRGFARFDPDALADTD